ncbi:SDR family NAD(P)-dependent oxidoreductase [Kribbella sp. NPDC023855]|uniref:SDR family NAD(P)-dependent oxidoreductase n=1 Tax=Kribbella sp. NPDC023855 TaxID=3154698 RepID=UPI003408CF72
MLEKKVIAVLGAGPGLGLSIARRFGREGFAVALVSRSAARQAAYREELSAAGIESRAYVADVRDPVGLRDVLAAITPDLGPIDTVYFGPVAADTSGGLVPITEVDAAAAREPFETLVLPAIELVGAVLPEMTERGSGAILIPGGLSGKYPIPMLGRLAPASAALRMYVLTLHEALKERGVYVATLTIGGLIKGGDIHTAVSKHFEQLEAEMPASLDPELIADQAWMMYVGRELPESEFSTLPVPA